jgi:hypothetical protein
MMTESHPKASSKTKSSLTQNVEDSWMDDEGHSEQAILDMDAAASSSSDDDDHHHHHQATSPDALSDSAWKKRRERKAVVAGVAGGVAGLVLLGPFSGVAAGVAGALISKRMNQKKEELTFETARNETELASLLTPKPQI